MSRFITPISDQRRPGPARPAAHQGDECAPAEGAQSRAFASIVDDRRRTETLELVDVKEFKHDPLRTFIVVGQFRDKHGRSRGLHAVPVANLTVCRPSAELGEGWL